MAAERAPRISANKLGEYMVATPARRRAIIAEQKAPAPFRTARYSAATGHVADFLRRGGTQPELLTAEAERLRQDQSGNQHARDTRADAADALMKIVAIADQFFVDGITYLQPPAQAPSLLNGSVTISVRPDLIAVSERRGVVRAGALKLHFIKGSTSLTTNAAQYVATLAHQWMLQFGGRFGQATPELSRSVDVFRGLFVPAPASQVRRMQDVAAACEEIAVRWPTL